MAVTFKNPLYLHLNKWISLEKALLLTQIYYSSIRIRKEATLLELDQFIEYRLESKEVKGVLVDGLVVTKDKMVGTAPKKVTGCKKCGR